MDFIYQLIALYDFPFPFILLFLFHIYCRSISVYHCLAKKSNNLSYVVYVITFCIMYMYMWFVYGDTHHGHMYLDDLLFF